MYLNVNVRHLTGNAGIVPFWRGYPVIGQRRPSKRRRSSDHQDRALAPLTVLVIFCLQPDEIRNRHLRPLLAQLLDLPVAKISVHLTYSTLNKIVTGEGENISEPVELQTLDGFCAAQRIAQISFLKTDTEGHDLEVLYGADLMLRRHGIDVVQVEVGMNPSNQKFVPFEVIKKHLESLDYRLFGLYEQVEEHYSGEVHLRRSNVVFVSTEVRETNRIGASKA